jgi:hypothetical protein
MATTTLRSGCHSTNIRLEGNVIHWGPLKIEFDADDKGGGAW